LRVACGRLHTYRAEGQRVECAPSIAYVRRERERRLGAQGQQDGLIDPAENQDPKLVSHRANKFTLVIEKPARRVKCWEVLIAESHSYEN
jgi:hypothetical protein